MTRRRFHPSSLSPHPLLLQIVVQADVRVVPRAIDLAGLDESFHLAARLADVYAVVEFAPHGRFLELREIVAKRLAVEVPEAELADAGRVDEIGAVAEVKQRRRRRRMASGSAPMQRVRGDLQPRVERVEDRRLSDAAVPDERRRLPG